MFLGASTLVIATALGVGRLKLATVLAMVAAAAASVACGILSSLFLVLKKLMVLDTLLPCVAKITTGTRLW